MAAAQLFWGIYSPNLSPLQMVSSDTVDRTSAILPVGGATRAVKFIDTYAPTLSPIATLTSDTADRTGTVLPSGGTTRAVKYVDIYAPQLNITARVSAFDLTSDEPIVLGTGTGTGPAVTTQSWYIG